MNPTSWDARCVGPVEIGVDREDLPFADLLRAFSRYQEACWPRLAEARAAWARIQTRELPLGDDLVRLQWNPGRVSSSMARVDRASIERRPCFLCPDRLPPEERALPWGPRLLVLCNPAPLLDEHLVLAHREHRPQDLASSVRDLVDFGHAAGPSWSLLYNGPRAGASAPDHLHLQAFKADFLPLERRVRRALREGRAPGRALFDGPDPSCWTCEDIGRSAWVFAASFDRVEACLLLCLELLSTGSVVAEEPPLNLLLFTVDEQAVFVLLPRAAHRPSCFYAEGPERVVVSPGSVDMGGMLVTVREEDFHRIDTERLRDIYAEVSLDPARMRRLDELLAERLSLVVWEGRGR